MKAPMTDNSFRADSYGELTTRCQAPLAGPAMTPRLFIVSLFMSRQAGKSLPFLPLAPFVHGGCVEMERENQAFRGWRYLCPSVPLG